MTRTVIATVTAAMVLATASGYLWKCLIDAEGEVQTSSASVVPDDAAVEPATTDFISADRTATQQASLAEVPGVQSNTPNGQLSTAGGSPGIFGEFLSRTDAVRVQDEHDIRVLKLSFAAPADSHDWAEQE